jgi:two-component SAPR family response regulator
MVGDFEGALRPLQEAVEEGRSCENRRNEAYALASLAEAEAGLGRHDDARRHYDEAIQLCAVDVRDETLFTLALAGASLAALGLGDIQKSDYLVARARAVAEIMPSRFELGMVEMAESLVRVAEGQSGRAVALAQGAVAKFESTNARAHEVLGRFVVAFTQFSANRRKEALETIQSLRELIVEPWQAGVLIPIIRQQPMFSQWAAAQLGDWVAMRDTIARHIHRIDEALSERSAGLPAVFARSLGLVSVAVEGEELREDAWVSSRAKELFFVLLANRGGIRKEQAVDLLYPDLSPEKCNSAFHSNVYRVRKALYPECVVKKDGAYLLNPEGTFEWDVQLFESLLARAERATPGSEERAELFEQALGYYGGPFAESFYSEWAESLRRRLEDRSSEAALTLAGFHAGRGEYEKAADTLQQVLSRDPYNAEHAYQLALYRARAGHPMRALSAIDDCRRAHEEDLGIPLPAKVRELRSQIAAGIAV